MFIVLLREGDSMIQIKFMVEVILLLMYVVSGDDHGVLMTVLNVHCTSFTGWGLILSYNWMDCLKLTSKHYNNCSKCMIWIVGVFPAITANGAVFCQPLGYGCVWRCSRSGRGDMAEYLRSSAGHDGWPRASVNSPPLMSSRRTLKTLPYS